MTSLPAQEQHRTMKRCLHCGEPFGYWIDDKFFTVSAHIHKMGEEKIKFHADGRRERLT